jgi:hypothetical protein
LGGRRFDGRPGGALPGGPPPGGALPGGALPGGALPGGALPGGALPAGALPGGSTSGAAGAATSANTQLVALLKATTTKWAAATVGSQEAAPLELASGKAILAIGGFNGGDNAPTLAQFQQLVAAGKVHYFVAGRGGFGGPGGGGGSGSAITSWVESHYSSQTVGSTTVYDLTKPTS